MSTNAKVAEKGNAGFGQVRPPAAAAGTTECAQRMTDDLIQHPFACLYSRIAGPGATTLSSDSHKQTGS